MIVVHHCRSGWQGDTSSSAPTVLWGCPPLSSFPVWASISGVWREFGLPSLLLLHPPNRLILQLRPDAGLSRIWLWFVYDLRVHAALSSFDNDYSCIYCKTRMIFVESSGIYVLPVKRCGHKRRKKEGRLYVALVIWKFLCISVCTWCLAFYNRTSRPWCLTSSNYCP